MTLRNTLLSNSMSVRFRHWKLPSQTTRLECAKVPHVTFNFTFRKSSSKPPPIRLLTTPLSTSGSEASISKQSSASGLAVLCGGSWSRAACFWSRSLSCERTISWCSSRRAASSDMACDVRDCVRENHVFDLCSKTVCDHFCRKIVEEVVQFTPPGSATQAELAACGLPHLSRDVRTRFLSLPNLCFWLCKPNS